jgi:hypothetical protein
MTGECQIAGINLPCTLKVDFRCPHRDRGGSGFHKSSRMFITAGRFYAEAQWFWQCSTVALGVRATSSVAGVHLKIGLLLFTLVVGRRPKLTPVYAVSSVGMEAPSDDVSLSA